MAVLRDFCDVYKLSRSAQSSPLHPSVFSQPRQRSAEHRFLSDEPKGSRQFRTYTSSEQMLCADRRIPFEFPRYSRLPAIGTIHEQGCYRPKLSRQRTYTVLNPVYVKGPEKPIEMNPKQPLVEPVKHLPKPFLKTKRLLPNRCRLRQDPKIQERVEKSRLIMQERFPNIVNRDCLHSSEELIEATKNLEIKESLNDNRMFWVQF